MILDVWRLKSHGVSDPRSATSLSIQFKVTELKYEFAAKQSQHGRGQRETRSPCFNAIIRTVRHHLEHPILFTNALHNVLCLERKQLCHQPHDRALWTLDLWSIQWAACFLRIMCRGPLLFGFSIREALAASEINRLAYCAWRFCVASRSHR